MNIVRMIQLGSAAGLMVAGVFVARAAHADVCLFSQWSSHGINFCTISNGGSCGIDIGNPQYSGISFSNEVIEVNLGNDAYQCVSGAGYTSGGTYECSVRDTTKDGVSAETTCPSNVTKVAGQFSW